MSEKVEKVQEGSYKGHPTLTLPNGSARGFTFGLGKARAFLDHVQDVRDFVERHAHSDIER